MKLIADSGSTKTDWALIAGDGAVIRFSTPGMNPNTTSDAELSRMLSDTHAFLHYREEIRAIYFYGAGCTGTENIRRMQELLGGFFTSSSVNVYGDMTGAVLAVRTGDEPCIVGILGTGANSCYFDGREIQGLDFSLGYILGDEGSGAWIGKRLLRDHAYQIMPADLRDAFARTYDLSRAALLHGVYRSAQPSAYLGSFAPFALTHRHDPYIQSVLHEGVSQFITYYLRRLAVQQKVVVHMIGGIAFQLQDIFTEQLTGSGFTKGKFLQTPMEGLIACHIREDI